jgi:hypothetical protein
MGGDRLGGGVDNAAPRDGEEPLEAGIAREVPTQLGLGQLSLATEGVNESQG